MITKKLYAKNGRQRRRNAPIRANNGATKKKYSKVLAKC